MKNKHQCFVKETSTCKVTKKKRPILIGLVSIVPIGTANMSEANKARLT